MGHYDSPLARMFPGELRARGECILSGAWLLQGFALWVVSMAKLQPTHCELALWTAFFLRRTDC